LSSLAASWELVNTPFDSRGPPSPSGVVRKDPGPCSPRRFALEGGMGLNCRSLAPITPECSGVRTLTHRSSTWLSRNNAPYILSIMFPFLQSPFPPLFTILPNLMNETPWLIEQYARHKIVPPHIPPYLTYLTTIPHVPHTSYLIPHIPHTSRTSRTSYLIPHTSYLIPHTIPTYLTYLTTIPHIPHTSYLTPHIPHTSHTSYLIPHTSYHTYIPHIPLTYLTSPQSQCGP